MTTTPATLQGLVVVTTPRRDCLTGILGFLQFVRNWRRTEPRICAVLIAMPSQTAASVKQEILALLKPGEHLGEMAPAADGCGPLFKFAAECAFRLVPKAAAMIHLPIDVEWGMFRYKDVQERIGEMTEILDQDGPALLLGDYDPMLWRNDKPAQHLTKLWIGKTVIDQLSQYGLDGPFQGLKQARTEFFAMTRSLFESAARAGAFAPFDPIPFVALHAWKQKMVIRKVPLGIFYESDATADPMRVRGQIMRFAHQAASEYLRRQDVTGTTEAMAMTDHWKRTVVAGMEKAFDAVAHILQLLQDAETRLDSTEQ